jgi:thioredoxin 1
MKRYLNTFKAKIFKAPGENIMSMMPVNNDTFEKEVLGDDTFKMMFIGAEWCGHCKAMRPGVMEFSAENPEIKLCYADADESAELAEKFGITSIPTTLVFKDKKEVLRKVGALSKQDLGEIVKNYR